MSGDDVSRSRTDATGEGTATAMPPGVAHARQQLLSSLSRQPEGIPKYVRLRHAIAENIAAGVWSAGQQLPTELDFVRITNLSQGTVQKALSNLEASGAITRSQGSGTFVRERKTPLANILVCRFLNDDETEDLPLFSEVLRRDRTIPVGAWTQHFGTADTVFRIDRRLIVNNEFNLLSRCYMSGRRFKRIASRPLHELSGVSLKSLIAEELSSPVTESVRTIRMQAFSSAACQAIGVANRTVGGIVEALGRSAPFGTVYFHEIYVPPSARKMVLSDS
jgi:GntR family transcriptional regulator